jgi:hypothetical protein
VYTDCAFCSGGLGGDGGPSGLPVGRRFAFDPWKSRAWVICARCGRWNLTPLDTRLDTIGALERMSGTGRVAATTAQVSLVRAGAYDVVRVGQPPRIEYATWRYGERLKAREREKLKVIIPATIVVVGGMVAFNAVVGGAMGGMVGQVPGMVQGIYTGVVGNRKVAIEPPICERCGAVLTLRNKHVQHARLTHTTKADLALLLACPKCRSYGALIEGADAETALRAGLTFTNLKKGKKLKKKAEVAAVQVERSGGPEEFIRRTTRLERTVKSLEATEALAVEMAVDEAAELHELERQWRQAEEIAEIADGLLPDRGVEEELKRLKDRGDGGYQPNG